MGTQKSNRSYSMKEQWNRKNYKLLGQYFLLSLFLVFVLECLSRQSLFEPFLFVYNRPFAFLFNLLLVFFTLCISLAFRKRVFTLLLVCGIWLGVCIANFVLMRFRSMPLTARDIMLMSSVRDIFEIYLSPVVLVLLMLMISGLWALIFAVYSICRKYDNVLQFVFVHLLILLAVLWLGSQSLVHAGKLDDTAQFNNLAEAYDRNGFAYCFSASALTGGVDEPDDYSSNEVEEILEEQTTELPLSKEDTPNIIFVQLESFFDPYYLKDLSFAYDPIPNFRNLKNHWPSGLLSVPCVGAGTANTEFEVLTGMNLSHFGVGEYPYTSIVDSRRPESIASILSDLGYDTHAIHNNNATFYDRHIVYDNLSFDSFTSLEYMDALEYNPLGWAKDTVLTEEILKCLRSNANRDFVFTVSVQPHGRYPKKPLPESNTISVDGMEDESRRNGLEYYLYELWESDRFVGELVQELKTFKEKTMVVFYGDHLPSFNIRNDELSVGSNQTTEYVVWANYALTREQRNLQTYQLSAYGLELCGIYEGAIFRHHQAYSYASDMNGAYQEDLQTLEYDMLYGEYFASDCEQENEDSPLQFDVEKILVRDVMIMDDGLFRVLGENFTSCSKIYINEQPCPTEFLSSDCLAGNGAEIQAGDVITVVQVSAVNDMDVLSSSNGLRVIF